jgi:hypothetical protein
MVPKGGLRLTQLPKLEKILRDVCDEWINKASVTYMRALPIERFKIMEKEIDIFGNLLMTMN